MPTRIAGLRSLSASRSARSRDTTVASAPVSSMKRNGPSPPIVTGTVMRRKRSCLSAITSTSGAVAEGATASGAAAATGTIWVATAASAAGQCQVISLPGAVHRDGAGAGYHARDPSPNPAMAESAGRLERRRLPTEQQFEQLEQGGARHGVEDRGVRQPAGRNEQHQPHPAVPSR